MTLLAWLGCGLLTAFVLCAEAWAVWIAGIFEAHEQRRLSGGGGGGGYRPTQRVDAPAVTPPRGSWGVPRKPETAAVLLARARLTNAQLIARRRGPPAPNPTKPHTRKDG